MLEVGQQKTRMALRELSVALGGREQNQIILSCAHPQSLRIYLEDSSEKAFREINHPAAQALHARVSELRRGRLHSRWGYRLRFGSKCAGGVLVVLVTYQTLLFGTASLMPVSWEKKFGAWISSAQETRALKDEKANREIERLGRQIAGENALATYDFRFRIIPDPTANAFASPGGFIGVHTGLVAGAKSPDEVAAVLAHEIEHVMRRHSLHGIMQKYGFALLMSLLFGDEGHSLSKVLAFTSEIEFSKRQERQADIGGLKRLEDAGLSGSGAAEFFQRTKTQKSTLGEWMEYLSTHPADAKRIRYLQDAAAKMKAPSHRPDIDWAAFKKICTDANPMPKTKS